MKKFVPNDFKTKSDEELIELMKDENNYGAKYELASRKANLKTSESTEEANRLFNEVREKCEEINDINSKAYLGRIYYYGKGVAKDYSKAKKCFDECYDAGDKLLSGFLGEIFYYGKGVEKDYERAKEYFEESYNLGDKYSIGFLGEMYYYGKGVEQDYEQARKYFEESAVKGDMESKFYLGLIFYNGLGIDQNYQLARQYFEECAKNNDSEALYYLGTIHHLGKGVEPDEALAEEYLKKSVDNGYYKSAVYLGEIYSSKYLQESVNEEYCKKAFEYFKKGFESGSEYAAFNLGEFYYYGKGVETDYKKAREYFEYAPSFDVAKSYIAKMYYFGYGVEQNIDLARELFDEIEPNADIVEILKGLRTLDPDQFESTKEHFEEMVTDQDFSSLFYIYEMYFNGFGVEKDVELANSYIYILVLTLLSTAIYFTLATKYGENMSLASTKEFLNQEKIFHEQVINVMPEGHPAKINMERIVNLGSYGYEIVKEIAFYALDRYMKSGKPDLFESNFTMEDDVENYIKELLKNYDSFIEIINLDK